MELEEPLLPDRVELIHVKLETLQGRRIGVRANMGRSRVVEREGVITQVHSSLFVVEIDERRGRKSRQSYQYVDVLTGAVELSDLETGELLFEPAGE